MTNVVPPKQTWHGRAFSHTFASSVLRDENYAVRCQCNLDCFDGSSLLAALITLKVCDGFL
jgi:hypothetical protein